MIGLAKLYGETARFDECEELLNRVKTTNEQSGTTSSEQYLACLHNLAWTFAQKGDYTEALNLLQKSHRWPNKCTRQEFPRCFGISARHGTSLGSHREIEKAEQLAKRVCDDFREAYGKNDQLYFNYLNSYAGMLQTQGKSAQALPLLLECLESSRKTMGNKHLETLTIADSVAQCLESLQQFDEAVALARENLETSQTVLGPLHPHSIQALMGLANAMESSRDYEQAESLYLLAIERSEQVPHSEARLLTIRNNLAYLYSNIGRIEDAIRLNRLVLASKIELHVLSLPTL